MRAVNDWDQWIEEELGRRAEQDLTRELRVVTESSQPVCRREGKTLLNLSSNNYLGLAGHPQLAEAMGEAIERGVGAGSPSSRLIVGHEEETALLESELANWQKSEEALVFGNGYMANLGVLSALLGREDAVFSDRFNHASIVDGIRLSGATHYRYRHRDMDHLENHLKKADQKGIRRKVIVTDAVFSMDGDLAPLQEIVYLKERYGAALFVDEAHSVGVVGTQGRGLAHDLGIAEQVDLHMGTFSKAFGVYGAYVSGKREWIRYLIHTARSFIYTTALPPVMITAIRRSLQLVKQGALLRQYLMGKCRYFREELSQAGFRLTDSMTPIIPIVLGESSTTLQFSKRLVDCGVLAVAIRPPTVPKGEARIRFSLMASHRDGDVQEAIRKIGQIGHECKVIT
ncbi:8-amino-7-oxononanoate synthase [Thermoactinomyces sp. DSM 45892]|uniref:8-amino-7-oxononanoate synthase n=1 Tax=Thermoactinomyces sp. DSM 45892 TaxID=1882753 RepID=UPI00089B8941|nr:8-amino-7-oxononanoate synthase [Thermoactinomyces sp. DSM 45892]SDY79822.1 8-amino-7-oxononanoate synthase [Thermoactinomyces sp. DSM 45892]